MKTKNLELENLLCILKKLLLDIEGDERIIVFRYDEDGVPIQVPGYYFGSTNGITFVEVDEEL